MSVEVIKMKKPMIAVAIIAIILISTILYTTTLVVASIDQVWLHERGIGESGEELTQGFWRITATTLNADLQFINFDDDLAEQYKISDSYPTDVQITGAIDFGVYQNKNPYWYIPVIKVATIEVTPEIYGYKSIGGIQPTSNLNNFEKLSTHSESVSVDIFKLDLSQKELIVPFGAGATKSEGENAGSLVTDHPNAVRYDNEYGTYFEFELSFKDITEGELTSIINWYNPEDETETAEMTLHWNVGGLEYDWTKEYIFVTGENGGIIQNNVFNSYDYNNIRQLLDHTLDNDWSFMNYYYGGSSVYDGDNPYPILSNMDNIMYQQSDLPTPIVLYYRNDLGDYSPVPVPQYQFLTEGYLPGTSQIEDTYKYPGWFTPSPTNNEGMVITSPDWYKYRLAQTPTIYNDRTTNKPSGLSICNYLAATSVNIASGTKPIVITRENPDVWGASNGDFGSIPDGFRCNLPLGARTWFYTLDISTELADTVVVTENHIDVEITEFKIDRESISAGSEAIITATLKNNSPYMGTVSHGITIPSELTSTMSVSGGAGALLFTAGQSQQVTLKIKNTGNLIEEIEKSLIYKVTNTEGRITDSETFTINFEVGLGVQDTVLEATVINADTNDPIDGITIKVFYGPEGDDMKQASTVDGVAIVELGTVTGSALIHVIDSGGRYEPQQRNIVLEHGVNQEIFELVVSMDGFNIDVPFPVEEMNWELVLVIIILSVTSISVAYIVKGRKNKGEWK